jgi:hypothetical protein
MRKLTFLAAVICAGLFAIATVRGAKSASGTSADQTTRVEMWQHPVVSDAFTGNTPFHHTVAELIAAGARVVSTPANAMSENYLAQGIEKSQPLRLSGGGSVGPLYISRAGDPAYTFSCSAYGQCDAMGKVLRGAGRLNFLALRRQLAAARIKAGTVAADFSVWRVSQRKPDAHDDSSIISPSLGHGVFRNCDPPFGRWIDIQATSLECRPFNASSPLNRPIPPNAKLMPNSANMMKYLLTKTGSVPGEVTAKCAAGIDPKCAGEHTDYGHPVYVSRKSDPLYTIH